MSKGKKITLWSVSAVVFVLAVGACVVLSMFRHVFTNHNDHVTIIDAIRDAHEAAFEPTQGFPGQDKLTLVCMGIDDNWTNSDVVYTAQARTDTLFVLTMDLKTKKATMLSIPRDTYAHIVGTKTNWHFKINAAYTTGGPDRTVATVNEFLGTNAVHYLVLNIDATKKMVDALGGVDVDVEHEMHYHDNWGHLSIDLKPGLQHLDGDNAVGFARYRHPDAGKKPTVEDGDDRRMYRQHVLLRAMVDKAKNFANVAQAPHLVDVAFANVRTDLTRTQLLDLAAIFKGVQQSDIETASLPGDDFRGADGAWFYKIKPEVAHAYADWLVKGDETASRQLVPVIVKNGTATPGLAQHVVAVLRAQGYTDVRNGGNAAKPKMQMADLKTPRLEVPRTVLLDTGVPNPNAPQDIALLLGVMSPQTMRHPVQPNKVGWTPPAAVTVTLGEDYAAAYKSAVASGALPPPSDLNSSAATSAN
jgi:LCP family protein required for cell wall assembly